MKRVVTLAWGIVLIYTLHARAADPSYAALLSQAGNLIAAQPNSTARAALDDELKRITSLPEAEQRLTALRQFVQGLEAASSASGSPPARVNIDKEIAACNVLTQYLCLLENLDGRGFEYVRKELVDNADTAGIDPETNRLYRRLVQACDEANDTFKAITYVDEDAGERHGEVWGQTLGYGVVSLCYGDATPLVLGAIESARGSYGINKTKNRQLTVVIDQFKARLSTVHFEVNARRSDLIQEFRCPGDAFITRELYADFIKAAAIPDPSVRATALSRVHAACPRFREASYYLGNAYHEAGDSAQARAYYSEVADHKDPCVRRDGLRANALCCLAYLAEDANESKRWAVAALDEAPNMPEAYLALAIAHLALGEDQAAREAGLKAMEANPELAASWAVCAMTAAQAGDDATALMRLRGAVERGFNDFDMIRTFPPCQRLLQSDPARSLLRPHLTVRYDPGIFSSDVVLANGSPYALINVRMDAKIRCYDAKGKLRNEKVFTATRDRLEPQGEHRFTCAPAKNKAVAVELTWTCDQHPDSMHDWHRYEKGDHPSMRMVSESP
jgi:tetratricopeptide (TPR) repeat protein